MSKLERKSRLEIVKRADSVEKPIIYPVQRAHNRISLFKTIRVIQCLCAKSLHKLFVFK